MRSHSMRTRFTGMSLALILALLAFTAVMVGCSDLADEPEDPGLPPGEEEPMAPPGEEEPMEPEPGEEPGDMAPNLGDIEGLVPPIDDNLIKSEAAARGNLTASQITITDKEHFVDWAAAYIAASGYESQLIIFRWDGSAWTFYDMGSYVDAGDLPSEVPQDLKNWAFN